MSQVCRQCSRINPADASYCYYDGAVLASHGGSGPINAGSAPFPSQFVFPTGQICKNFDQLALACQQNWHSALDMLKQGFLGTFFGGLGRADLALAAMEAARFPDVDRGLDRLLSKLPTNVLQNPQLNAEPTEINLGQVPLGSDRNSEIHLSNHGMRLLYGSVVADCKWLTLGEAPGGSQKLFQFGGETIIPVHIRGQHLRAGTKPLEGHLVVESNGGTAMITFRADVPVMPYKGGLFDGSLTPRRVAEKAKADPKAAAPYFESGAVAKWFESNGWTYPVRGPSAKGLGGVQQYFEALGLARAPKVAINSQSLSFRGDGGQTLQATLEVSTQEKKPVYAYATCDQPWVECAKVKLAGRTATITVIIPRVPNRPGEALQATIRVTGNGNQKFKVSLLLTVDKADPNPPPQPVAAPPERASAEFVMPAQDPIIPAAAAPFADMITATPLPITDSQPATPPSPPYEGGAKGGWPPLLRSSTTSAVLPPRREVRIGPRKPLWVHLTPLVLLLAALVGVLFWDAFSTGSGGSDSIDATQRLSLLFDYADTKEKDIYNSMNFGLVMVDPSKSAKNAKLLTYHPRGQTNSAVALIDGQERHFGSFQAGKWEDRPKPQGKYRAGKVATFVFSGEGISVTQRVEVVPGEAVEVSPDVYKRLLDTCLVRYTIKNRDSKSHKIGLRFLLDTYIGSNDGCPFTIPGTAKLVTTYEDFNPSDPKNGKPIPDFVQALERENLRDPGIIAQVNFRVGDTIAAPDRVSLTAWPGGGDHLKRYIVPVTNIEQDSAVVMYWHPADLEPGKTRELGFSYGLGNISAQSERIGLTFGGSFVVKGELSVVALIAEPRVGQYATIEFPQGACTLLEGFAEKQLVPTSQEKAADGRMRASPVTWRLRANRDGSIPITVKTSDRLEATRKITIKKSSIF